MLIKKIYRKCYNITHGNKLKKAGVRLRCDNSKLNKNTMSCSGINNEVYIGADTYLQECCFHIYGDNNKIYIGKGGTYINVDFYLEGNCNCIEIGNNTIISGRTQLACTEGKEIVIGDDCLFSNEIFVRTGDSHAIYDQKGNRINEAKNVFIGEHVWIGHRVTVLKGSIINNGVIVGTGSILTGKEYEKNSIVVGNPAKIVKNNVKWTFTL